MKRSTLWLACFVALGLMTGAPARGAALGVLPGRLEKKAATPPPAVSYSREIEPILAENCYHCHGPDSNHRKARLRLDTHEGALAGGKEGPAIVPGDAEKSGLVQRIFSADPDEQMPPPDSNRVLTQQQKALLKNWVDEGAAWGKHWSLVPPERPALPEVKDGAWVRNPIDQFILAKLEQEGLAPSPETSRQKLIRRVTLDLTGLPPTLQEIDDFVADTSVDAYEKVVDRLLASPRYGERMVLEWLDAARYADSNGYQQDKTRTMWPWRDWVIRAFNSNMPFDQFTIEQLAGDLLPNATLQQKIATGFNRNCMLNGEGGRIPEESRNDYVFDRVETTSTIWMGLTLGCCRCHDHKFDPFTQKDFYQLFAYFNNVPESGAVDAGGNANPVTSFATPEERVKIAALEKSVGDLDRQLKAKDKELLPGQAEWEGKKAAAQPAKIQAILRKPAAQRSPKEKTELTEQFLSGFPDRVKLKTELERDRKTLGNLNTATQAMVMADLPKPRQAHVLIRGNYEQPGEPVAPDVPSVLPPLPANAPKNRLALARWIVSPGNPLTARVTVNRYWQLFFGTGLVKTIEDFGVQGEKPSHPELLDWLATEFVRTGWNVKAMHRLIVTSAAYRQSSRVTPALLERDPANRLLARGPRFRLSSFVLRDQALAISGLLVDKVGGPPVRPYQPPGIWEEMSFGQIKYDQDKGDNLYRRSVYIYWRRTVGPTMMFDTPSRQVCTVRQQRTNTPLQSLVLLNEPGYLEAARVLAEKLLEQKGLTEDQRIAQAFRLATARPPGDAEMTILRTSLDRLRRQYQADPPAAIKLVSIGAKPRDPALDPKELAAYTTLNSLILNLDETLTKE